MAKRRKKDTYIDLPLAKVLNSDRTHSLLVALSRPLVSEIQHGGILPLIWELDRRDAHVALIYDPLVMRQSRLRRVKRSLPPKQYAVSLVVDWEMRRLLYDGVAVSFVLDIDNTDELGYDSIDLALADTEEEFQHVIARYTGDTDEEPLDYGDINGSNDPLGLDEQD